MKKTIKSVIGMLCAATLAFSAAACGNLGGGSSTGSSVGGSSTGSSSVSVSEGTAASFVSLDINPTVELTVDGNNVVVSVYGGNEDGKVLLYDGEDLVDGIVGADVETAVEKITDLAVELGYLSEDNKVVNTSVSGENAETLQSKINTKITAVASELGLSVTTDMEGAFSLLRDFEQFKAAYPNNAAIQALTVEDFRLALSASETGEVTLEAAVEMDDSALVEMIANAHKQADIFATEAFKDAKNEADAAYEKAVGMAVAGVYITTYPSTTKPLLAPYAAAYFMYEASACGFELIAHSLDVLERVSNYEFNETQIAAVLSALGLENTPENVALIANEDGKVTVDSVEAYADVLFKNTAASEELETMKTELSAALASAESVLAQAIKDAKEVVLPEIEAIITVGESGASILKSELVQAVLPEIIKTAVDDFDGIAEDVRTELTTGELTAAELKEYAATLHEKAEAVAEALEEQLTEEDLAALEAAKQQAVDGCAQAKAEMDAAIATAEEQARKYLQDKRQALLDKTEE